MTNIENITWESKRSKLNHDDLKNKYLRRLRGFIGRFSFENIDVEKVNEFIIDDLHFFEQYDRDIRSLMAGFENEMSPKRFFEVPPLSRCPEDTKNWLCVVSYELWADRCNAKEIKLKVEESLDKAKNLFQYIDTALGDTPADNPDICLLKELLPKFTEYNDALIKLSDALSAFSAKVKLI